MSLQECVQPGALLKEYKPKIAEPDKPKTHSNPWDYGDEPGGWGESQAPRAEQSRDDAPEEDHPQVQPKKAFEPDASYTAWKTAQLDALTGRIAGGKKAASVETVGETILTAEGTNKTDGVATTEEAIPGELTREPAEGTRRAAPAKPKSSSKGNKR